MKLLTDAFEYNAWAARQLGEVCRTAAPEQLTNKEDWQYKPILELFSHVDQVERAYLRLMGVAEIAEPAGELESFLATAPLIRDSYVAFTTDINEAGLERMFEIPWFGRSFTVRDGLFQVLAHSIEHRADIAHFLSRLGYKTPPIDYIAWVYVNDGGVIPE